MSILDKTVSYYPNKEATIQGVDVNLLTILQSTMHRDFILKLRSSPEEIQKRLKDTLPCYTVGGRFSRRCTEGLIKPSGLACVDLDGAEGKDIQYLLKELRGINCIAYAGLSCRGQRLFCIVPFLYHDKYELHYERLIQSFTDMGLPMGDSCHKAISQPRFVSWNDDSTQFFRHDAKPYYLLPPKRTYHLIKPIYKQHKGSTKPLEIASKMIRNAEDGGKYYAIRDASYLLGGYAASGAIDEAEALDLLRKEIEDKPNVKDLKAALRTIEECFQAGKLKPLTIGSPKSIQANQSKNTKDESKQEVNVSTPASKTGTFGVPLVRYKVSGHTNWDEDISKLETFFNELELPSQPISLKQNTTIANLSLFIQSHLAVVKANNGNKVFLPYLERLQELQRQFAHH